MDPYLDDVSFERTEQSSGGSSWIWIILLIVALIAIAGLVVWVVLLYRTRDSKGKIVQFTGAKIFVTGPKTITATWPTPSDKNDSYTLYASLDPPIYNDKGAVTNAVTNGSSTASSGATTTQVAGLQNRLKYYATLVVTNSKTNNYQVYNQLVFMETAAPPGPVGATGSEVLTTFTIQDILQVGKLQVPGASTGGVTGDVQSVEFSQNPVEADSLFYMNGNSQIQIDETTGLTDFCLWNIDGELKAQSCGATGAATNSKWTYNPSVTGTGATGATGTVEPSYTNQWCLTSTLNNPKPTCMILQPITQANIGTFGTATVKVADTSKVGDEWVNALETRND